MAMVSTPHEAASAFVNTSGMGRYGTVPDEVRGLCWGGFLTPLPWGIGNRTWIVLLILVPYVGWIMSFVILFKGNEWAWRNRAWQDVAQFKRHQRGWTIAGIIINVIGIILLIALYHSQQAITGYTL